MDWLTLLSLTIATFVYAISHRISGAVILLLGVSLVFL